MDILPNFSARYGYGQPKEISIRDDAPEDLRYAFLNLVREVARKYLGDYPEEGLRDVITRELLKKPDSNWHIKEVWEQVERMVYQCEWNRFYDLMEPLEAYFQRNNRNASTEFRNSMNALFVKLGVGWQFSDGRLIIRGDESFQRAANLAASDLEKAERPTAASHIRFALKALSERPVPNTAGAVAHATSSVECVLSDVTSEELTLGKYLDRHPGLFHPALKKALGEIYGYASDAGARHGKEGVLPSFDEAQFALTTCAAVCSLLNATNPKRPS